MPKSWDGIRECYLKLKLLTLNIKVQSSNENNCFIGTRFQKIARNLEDLGKRFEVKENSFGDNTLGRVKQRGNFKC